MRVDEDFPSQFLTSHGNRKYVKMAYKNRMTIEMENVSNEEFALSLA